MHRARAKAVASDAAQERYTKQLVDPRTGQPYFRPVRVTPAPTPTPTPHTPHPTHSNTLTNTHTPHPTPTPFCVAIQKA
jgi:hypothetical protein